MGPAGLGWAPATGPTRPGLLFAFLWPRDSVRFSGRGRGSLVCAGPGGTAGRLPGRSERRPVCSGDSGLSEHSSPGLSAGGFHLRGGCDYCQVSPLIRASGRNQSWDAGSLKPPASFSEHAPGSARWALGPQLSPLWPGTQCQFLE